MISASDARELAREHLEGFPPSIADAYLAFAANGDQARLDEVVLGVLEFYLAKPPPASLAALPGTTRLREDLGCDSLTMIDLIFLSENLFAFKLADEELKQIATLDDLRRHFRERVVPQA
jgi:acyl carrier protein